MDPLDKLRPAPPTPEDEVCSCSGKEPIKLMYALSENPIHCLDCNGEVDPGKLQVSADLIEAIVRWRDVYGSVHRLWLDSGDYEAWAAREMSDLDSYANRLGRSVQLRVNEERRCYYWLHVADEESSPTACPSCSGPLSRHNGRSYPHLLCERCSIVIAGNDAA